MKTLKDIFIKAFRAICRSFRYKKCFIFSFRCKKYFILLLRYKRYFMLLLCGLVSFAIIIVLWLIVLMGRWAMHLIFILLALLILRALLVFILWKLFR